MPQMDLFYLGATDVMPVSRRADSGAWQVSVGKHRKSDQDWSKADALRYESSLRKPNGDHTLDEALDRWLDEYVPFLKNEDNYRRKAEKLRPFLKAQPLQRAPEIAAAVKKEWRGLKPATINRRLAILKRLVKLAFEEWPGWLNEAVHRKIKLIPERNERYIFLTRAEVERLRMNCRDPENGDLIVFAALTGLRRSEMFRVCKQHITNGTLHVDARTKNGKPRSIPLHLRALAIAERMPLFTTPAKLQDDWTESRKKSGLEYVHWHDLRHTFASWLVQQGTDLLVVKDLMSHSSVKQTERYAHLAPHQARQEVMRL